MDKDIRGETIMSATTRVNGHYGNDAKYQNFITGTLRTTQDFKAFLIRIASTSNGSNTWVDLQAQDGDAVADVDQIVERVIGELHPLMYLVPSAADGYIHVIMHGHNVTASSIADRIDALGGGIGTDTTVTLGTAIAVS
jgi:hypothetical protein